MDDLLHTYASEKQHDSIRRLVAEWAGINGLDERPQAPLLCAIRNGDSEMLTLLIQLEADTSIRDDSNHAPLHVAVLNGNLPVVKILLTSGGDLYLHLPLFRRAPKAK